MIEQLPALPLGGGIGAAVWLIVWLIKRGDIQGRTVLTELRRQRDEAIRRADRLQSQVDRLRARLHDTDPHALLDKDQCDE